MPEKDNTPDPNKEKQSQGRLLLAPFLWLREDEFKEGLVDIDTDLPADEIREKCFEVLHLIDQYHRPGSKEDTEQMEKEFAMADTKVADDTDWGDINDYLRSNQTNDSPSEKSEDTEPIKKHQDIIVQRVRKLLSFSQVRDKIYGELEREYGHHKKYRKDLRVLRKMLQAQQALMRDMHDTYLKSKRRDGKLVASAGEKIKKLAELKTKAQSVENSIIDKATAKNGPELGLITTQELLRYKGQMKEKGFALTPTRQALLNKVTEYAMAGKKVFLVGSTGTGKTELAFYAANAITGDYEIIPWHEGTVPRDVLGQLQIRKDAQGEIESRFQPGPMPRAYTKGEGLIHEEVTAGSTRAMMGMKPYLNLKPGDRMRIPEANGDILEVSNVVEFFTGNPKDERTKDREELDPAILRMLHGIEISYMPAEELAKIILAQLIEDNGVLELSKNEVALIQKLAAAAEMMQQCHDNNLSDEAKEELKNATGVEDLRLVKNFLDPGTLFGLFAKYDYEKTKGVSFDAYLSEQLQEFIKSAKTLEVPEERTLALAILQLKGVITEDSTQDKVNIEIQKRGKDYLLPSELGFLNSTNEEFDDDPFADLELDLDLRVKAPEKEPTLDETIRDTLEIANQFPPVNTDDDINTPLDEMVDPFADTTDDNTPLDEMVDPFADAAEVNMLDDDEEEYSYGAGVGLPDPPPIPPAAASFDPFGDAPLSAGVPDPFTETISDPIAKLASPAYKEDDSIPDPNCPEPVRPPENYDGMSDMDILEDIERQYYGRTRTMQYFDIPGKVPDIREIREALEANKEKMRLIRSFKKPRLIIAPAGTRLNELAEKIGSKRGKMVQDKNNPAQDEIWISFKEDNLVYLPKQFTLGNHRGTTIENFHQDRSGRSVLIVEGEQETRMSDKGKTADEALQEWKSQRYAGITTEEALMLHAEGVIDPFDNDSFNTESEEMLLGTFLRGPSGPKVPIIIWSKNLRKIILSFRDTKYISESTSKKHGTRRAVRIDLDQ